VRVSEVFRQAAHSRIITTAHRINEGQVPELPGKDAQSDFYFIDRAEPEQIANTLVVMVKTRIARPSPAQPAPHLAAAIPA
jgi:exodeoxyribonuclease V alpha subunit